MQLLTDNECVVLLTGRQTAFVEQTRMIAHVIEPGFIERVVAAYDRVFELFDEAERLRSVCAVSSGATQASFEAWKLHGHYSK